MRSDLTPPPGLAAVVGRDALRGGLASLIATGLLVGVLLGAASAAAIGARRSHTAAERLISGVDPPWGMVRVAGSADPEALRWLADLPEVRRIETFVLGIGRTTGSKDWFYPAAFLEPTAASSMTVVAGRMFHPDGANELVVSARTAETYPLGSTVDFAPYDDVQFQELLATGTNSNDEPRGRPVRFNVVGVVADLSDNSTTSRKVLYASPAYANVLRQDGTTFNHGAWVYLHDGASVESFEDALQPQAAALAEQGAYLEWLSDADLLNTAGSTARLSVGALLVFSAVTTVATGAALLVVVHRRVTAEPNTELWWQLGIGHGWRTALAAAPYLLLIVVALPTLLATSIALSGSFPLGVIRYIERRPGTEFNVALSIGTALAAVAMLSGIIGVAAHLGTRLRPGLDAPVVQRRFARRRVGLQLSSATPQARRGMVGACAAACGVVSVVVLAASEAQLHRSPQRFGVPWDALIEASESAQAEVVQTLTDDPDIAAVGLAGTIAATIGNVPSNIHTVVGLYGVLGPTILEGRQPIGSQEIALGPELLEQLEVEVGETVTVRTVDSSGAERTTALRVAGASLVPTTASDFYAAEAVVAPAAFADLAPGRYFQDVVLRVHPGVDVATKLEQLDLRFPAGVQDESRPAAPGPISQLHGLGPLPLALAGVFFVQLVALAVVSSAVSGRQSRSTLAVLRCLGHTSRQTTLVRTEMAAGFSGAVIAAGGATGLLLGSVVWRQIARSIHVAPDPLVPTPSLVLAASITFAAAWLATFWSTRTGRGTSFVSTLRAQERRT